MKAFFCLKEVLHGSEITILERFNIRSFCVTGKESSKGQSLSDSREAYNILKPLFAEKDDVEKVYFIFLDGQNRILAIENLFSGSITASPMYPREIVKRLIELKSSTFLMAHNHPSGDLEPSAEDKSMTIKVGLAPGYLGITTESSS